MRLLLPLKEVSDINLKNFLQTSTIFSGLTDEELKYILDIINVKEYKRNEIIFFEGDEGISFYILITGEIRIYKLSQEGREKTLALLDEGNFFGEMALLENKKRSANAQTDSRSQLGVIHKENFYKLIEKYPQIASKMIVHLADRLRRANQQIEALTFKDVQGRLANFLLQYAKNDVKDGPIPLQKRFTHQDIANLIGSSRETVTRLLNQFQEKDLILIEGRTIFVNNTKGLKGIR